MKDFINQEQIIREVGERTGFGKKYLKEAFDAMLDIIEEHMMEATIEQPSEIRLFHGWKLGAKRWPERTMIDPRNGQSINVPSKITPYCSFETSYKNKIRDKDFDVNNQDE